MRMPHIPSYVSPTDPRDIFRDRSIIDQSTACYDPDNEGVGSTYYGDPSASRVFIPPPNGASPPNTRPRTLVRLCGIYVEPGQSCRIRGLRQAVGLGCLLTSSDPDAPAFVPLEMDQVSPFWRFTDGNIAWGLRAIFGTVTENNAIKSPLVAGNSIEYASGVDSSILITQDEPTDPSRAPAGGFFPGEPIGSLGLFRDLRFPWASQSAGRTMDYELRGPVLIGFYASVLQTDPDERQDLNALLPSGFIPPNPEDAFLVELARAGLPPMIFRHISGSIIAEIGTVSQVPGIDPVMGKSP